MSDRPGHLSLVDIIAEAVDEARRSGKDQAGQTDHAVNAILAAEPTLGRRAARRLVKTLLS